MILKFFLYQFEIANHLISTFLDPCIFSSSLLMEGNESSHPSMIGAGKICKDRRITKHNLRMEERMDRFICINITGHVEEMPNTMTVSPRNINKSQNPEKVEFSLLKASNESLLPVLLIREWKK